MALFACKVLFVLGEKNTICSLKNYGANRADDTTVLSRCPLAASLAPLKIQGMPAPVLLLVDPFMFKGSDF